MTHYLYNMQNAWWFMLLSKLIFKNGLHWMNSSFDPPFSPVTDWNDPSAYWISSFSAQPIVFLFKPISLTPALLFSGISSEHFEWFWIHETRSSNRELQFNHAGPCFLLAFSVK